jgi:hypothetical protein
MTTTIAFIGLGAMGSRMAGNLQKAGYALRVFNRSSARMQAFVQAGAVGCSTPAQVTRGARFVVSMVADDDATRQVMLGLRGCANCRPADQPGRQAKDPGRSGPRDPNPVNVSRQRYNAEPPNPLNALE